MKRLKTLMIFSLVMLLSLSTTSAQDHRYDAGVSRELAEWRKATIKDVRYELYFDLVEDRGVATINFNLDAPQEVVIDLRNTDLVSDVISGETSILNYCTLANEHIVMPASNTHAGSNRVSIVFAIDNQALNRKPDFLYTLLVPDRARTLFPCFDQPDMKATYELHLTIPKDWVAVSNTSVSSVLTNLSPDYNIVSFNPTPP